MEVEVDITNDDGHFSRMSEVCENVNTNSISSVLNSQYNTFDTGCEDKTVLKPIFHRDKFLLPPSYLQVISSLPSLGLPSIRHRPVHCSDTYDVPDKPVETLGRTINLGHTVTHIPGQLENIRMKSMGMMLGEEVGVEQLAHHHQVRVQTVSRPPTRKDVKLWCKARRFIKEQKEECEEVVKQKIKLRVRLDSGDSVGTEMSSSSSESSLLDLTNKQEEMLTKVRNNSSADQVLSSPLVSDIEVQETTQVAGRKRRISWDDQIDNSEQQNNTVDSSGMLRQKLNDDSVYRAQFLTPQTRRVTESRIEAPSPATPRPMLDLGNVAGSITRSFLTLLGIELHVTTRQQLRPDPEFDQVEAMFYQVVVEGEDDVVVGCVVVGDKIRGTELGHLPNVRIVTSELELVRNCIRLVRDVDPDILSGWEVQMASWGYLLCRAASLGINIAPLLSRVPGEVKESKFGGMGEENNPGAQYNADHTSDIVIVGRTVFNLWRMMRSELALNSYSLENIARMVVGERRPTYTHRTLTNWWRDDKTRARVVEHYVGHLNTVASILNRLDLLSRSCELSRLFGIQLSEIFSRGSQFRVESSMLRLAKPRNYVPVSPTRQQLGGQAAPEYLALLLEPESRMYVDPVVVLDFQSLYPSIMIAYNYCFTTCLGRLQHLGNPGPYEFGCSQLKTSPERLEGLDGNITISPGGIVFVKQHVRKGILPRMLEDILNTRIMVKQSMKKHKDNPQIQKILHSRQLGLKLIANVTYGYTSANFSGRMPCIEVGDSVVAKGREALERAIKTIECREDWGGRVVYGDTDSVFVLLEGKSKEEAFRIGEEMAKVITEENPKPMKLKFEKVYLPCLLQTKKRYVGYMWETRDQLKPAYDAKGIETVRRDGIPATVKILEKSIKLLFDTKDVSLVKKFVLEQFRKIMSGSVSLQDLTFAKEFRGLRGYRPGACVPSLELTKQSMKLDRRNVPCTGERVPYVVVYGEPGLPLIQLVRSPHTVLNQPHLRTNGHYYVTKVVGPPLNRCLLLVGADCLSWFSALPRQITHTEHQGPVRGGQVISQYFVSRRCAACAEPAVRPLCTRCSTDKGRAVSLLSCQIHQLELSVEKVVVVCVVCSGHQGGRLCISLDCPVIYKRKVEINRRARLEILDNLLCQINS